jgi:hypothetical protein
MPQVLTPGSGSGHSQTERDSEYLATGITGAWSAPHRAGTGAIPASPACLAGECSTGECFRAFVNSKTRSTESNDRLQETRRGVLGDRGAHRADSYPLSIGPAYLLAIRIRSQPGPDRVWPIQIVESIYAPVGQLAQATNSTESLAAYVRWWTR